MSGLGETIRGSGDGPSGEETTALPHLFVVLECARPLAGGASVRLEGIDEVVLGRAPTRSVSLSADGGKKQLALGVPDGRMSSRHAKLSRGADGWTLEDLGSTNGTFVDGQTISRAAVGDGGVFDLGGTIFALRTALPTGPRAHVYQESETLAHRALGLATLVPAHAEATVALAKIAASEVPVLLLGESGTGKEVTARAVHALSRRAGGFVPVNCGALPETLLESQLFGHVKGAFSGASRDEVGLVRASDKGSLFLDEIGDMPRPSQVALLRLLQEKEVTPVGATKPVPVDLRVIAATHRPVDSLESAGFRADLYARVAGYTHRLAPLRERIVDLGLLVAALLPKVAADGRSMSLAIDLARAMVAHPWPLNVRELEQALRVMALLATDGVLRLAHAPESLRAPRAGGAEDQADAAVAPEDAKIRDALVAALTAHRGNVTHVANEMRRTRMQIHRWMRRFGLDPNGYRR